MNEQDQNRACAELDGNWIITHGFGNMVHFKNYNTYDAIIPLIQKQPKDIQRAVVVNWWQAMTVDIDDMVDQINATPAQLREALLRATGKWKD